LHCFDLIYWHLENLKKMNDSYQKIFKLTLFIILVSVALIRFPIDDGLRHVGLAFGNFTSWGDVYPFSIFEELKDYDPWFGYDFTLGLIADLLKHFPLSLLTLKFVLTKIICLLFSLTFFYLVLERSGILNKIKDRDSFVLVLIILVAFLIFTFGRVIIARPFAFGTFFILYSVNRQGFIRGVVSSGMLTFFYSYLSWFYIVPVAFAHFIKGNKKFAWGAVGFISIFLVLQPPSFWGFQSELFMSDLVRNTLETKISEFHLTLTYWMFYLYLVGGIIFFPKVSKEAKSLSYLNVLILIYLLPAIKYIRYFLDITLPLLFVNNANDIFNILIEPYRKLVFSWKTIAVSKLDRLKSQIKPKIARIQKTNAPKKVKSEVNLKPYIVASYAILLILAIQFNLRQITVLREFREILTPIPKGSQVLTSFNLQYQTLYLRPDLRVIPSCEMGFTKKSVAEEYTQYFNEGFVSPLAKKTGSKYFLEGKDHFIDPREGCYLKLSKKSGDFKLWNILTQPPNSDASYVQVNVTAHD